MKSDLELTNLIDAYLKRELTGLELSNFEQLRKDDPSFDIKVVVSKCKPLENCRFARQLPIVRCFERSAGY